VTALEGYTTNQQDYVSPAEPGGHSISQMWAIDELPNGNYSDVEFGWINSAYFGSSEPTLFVYHFDDSEPTCYDGCGFVQISNTLGYVAGYPILGAATLFSLGSAHDYQIYEDGTSGNWYLAIDGEVVGYFPASAWAQDDPTLLTLEEAGGEVASETTDPTAQTTMGDGNPGSSEQGAEWTGIQDRAAGSTRWVNFDTLVETTPAYSVGAGGSFTNGGPYGSNFRYGGPGWCADQSPGYCVPPSATTEEAVGQTQTEATLVGTTNPDGLDAHYYFEYGSSPSFGLDSPAPPGRDAANGIGPLQERDSISGLLPGTIYYYRLVAESSAGRSYGAERSFATLADVGTVTVVAPSPSLGSANTSPTPGSTSTQTITPTVEVSPFSASRGALSIRVTGVKFQGNSLDLRVEVSRGGGVRIDGRSLKTMHLTLSAGAHWIKVPLTARARASLARHHELVAHLVLSTPNGVASVMAGFRRLSSRVVLRG
jgi:hypothetical protein